MIGDTIEWKGVKHAKVMDFSNGDCGQCSLDKECVDIPLSVYGDCTKATIPYMFVKLDDLDIEDEKKEEKCLELA